MDYYTAFQVCRSHKHSVSRNIIILANQKWSLNTIGKFGPWKVVERRSLGRSSGGLSYRQQWKRPWKSTCIIRQGEKSRNSDWVKPWRSRPFSGEGLLKIQSMSDLRLWVFLNERRSLGSLRHADLAFRSLHLKALLSGSCPSPALSLWLYEPVLWSLWHLFSA